MQLASSQRKANGVAKGGERAVGRRRVVRQGRERNVEKRTFQKEREEKRDRKKGEEKKERRKRERDLAGSCSASSGGLLPACGVDLDADASSASPPSAIFPFTSALLTRQREERKKRSFLRNKRKRK